ncbi:MAG TPA: TOBE domain-containing protein [Candidatus Hypogeohydataceae bacterium YC41]
MKISGRNKLAGEIIDIKQGDIVVQVTMKVGEHKLVSVITRESCDEMKLKVGDKVTALIKATEVMLIK